MMKVVALIGSCLLMTALFGVSAHAGPWVSPIGTYCTADYPSDECEDQDNFKTKFWKENFFGGGPGQPGNILMAVGKGFMLQNVVLDGLLVCGAPGCGLDTTHP